MASRKTLLCWLALLPLIAANLFPFLVMLSTALKPASEVLSGAPSWVPSRLAWHNFAAMWRNSGFAGAILNSVYVSAVSAAIAVLVSLPAAYAVARYRFRAKGLYRDFLLITQMVPPVVLVLGLFRLAAWLGLLNSLTALLLIYASFQIAFAIWMLQSYFASIPLDLEEAAWLEGASRLRSACTIFLPMALPAIAVTTIFAFINAWNEFIVALTMLRDQSNYTLPIQIFALVAGRYQVEWEQVMAAALVATVPVAVLFAWLQRYLVVGLAGGAVK